MKYVGSKNKLAKELVPIIQSYITENTKGYLEPFVGGANMIDKIKHNNKIGCDIHEELIELLKYTQTNAKEIPLTVSKEEYLRVRDNKDNYDKWYVGLVGFCASYNAKYFGGYAGQCNTKQGIRNYDQEAIRNLTNQSDSLREIKFYNMPFLELPLDKIKNYVIYCDIPYRETTEYKTDVFPYDEFYNWAIEASKNNVVLISEYWMPEGKFKCIWSKEHRTFLDKNNNDKKRVEKLFVVNNED